jgi:hypothetical protein
MTVDLEYSVSGQFGLPCSTFPTSFLGPLCYSGQVLNNGPVDTSFLNPLSPSWFQDLDFSTTLDLPYKDSSLNANGSLIRSDELSQSPTGTLQPQFSHRTRSIQQGSLTAKMIFSKLGDYVRMMGEGKTLPPFIHPPCVLGQGDECASDSPHKCLPEILAVCANLTHLFYARVPGSSGYVWQQICTHLRQLRADVSPNECSLACCYRNADTFISLRHTMRNQCYKLCR